MLQNLKELYGTKISAKDGDIGHIKDFYFNDQSWAVRFLVVDTGSWLNSRQVLLSPHAFGVWDRSARHLHVNLTKKQIEDSPLIDSNRPVSRQFEADYYAYYGWPAYWQGDGLWGAGAYPIVLPAFENNTPRASGFIEPTDRHLRSTKAVQGYDIQATDGAIGTVSGFNVEDRGWHIGELIVEAGHWYSGKEILILSNRVSRISYADAKVFVSLTKADIRQTAEHGVATAGCCN